MPIKITPQRMFFISLLVIAGLLYLLSSILTPFLLGALLAYLSNPLVKRLEKHGAPHLLSVVAVLTFVVLGLLLLMLMLVPLIEKQVAMLVQISPQIFAWLQDKLSPILNDYIDFGTIKTSLSSTISKSGWILGAVLQSGYTLMSWTMSFVLTPVVTFYMLRDWDKMINVIKNFIPKQYRATWVSLAKSCDNVLSAFFRGQLIVMFLLALIYGIGLSLVGLQVGFIIGFIGGILSIVPYLGSIFVLVMSVITSLVQFGDAHNLIWVVIVFMIGQGMEGYVLTPYFVGGKIGLHPVVVIFAVLAGGVLFGTVGVLLALPASAVIKVLLVHLREQYMPA